MHRLHRLLVLSTSSSVSFPSHRPPSTTLSNDLSTIPLDPLGKSPALTLQLLILPQIHTILRDHSDRIAIQTPRIAVEEDFHALPHRLLGPLPRHILHIRLIGDEPAQDRLREMRAETGGQRRGREGGAQQIGAGEERSTLGVETGDEELVPERIEVGPSLVEHFAEVGVQVLSV